MDQEFGQQLEARWEAQKAEQLRENRSRDGWVTAENTGLWAAFKRGARRGALLGVLFWLVALALAICL